MIYDMVIIGGGPAGMSAALYAARQNLDFVLIAKKLGGMANNMPTIETFLTHQYLTGYELVEKCKAHLKRYNIQNIKEEVISVEKKNNGFLVKTKSQIFETKTIIIATGRRFKKLNIPGEDKFKGKGLSDCTACDGPLFKNKTVAVIGGGRTGLYGTLFLLKIAKKIYLIEKSNEIKTQEGIRKIAEAIQNNKKVEIITDTYPIEVKGNKFVNELILRKKGKIISLPIEGVFVEIGYDPNTGFLRNLLNTNKRNEVLIDAECKTNVKGIFAAGDVTHIREKQVVVSTGEGAKAILSAIVYLEKNKK